MTTNPIPNLSEKERLNFWNKVDIRHPDSCWPWMGAKLKDGYGTFRAQKVQMRTSRWTFALTTGPALLDGKEACHTCDNGICCNPLHIFPGTHKQNMHDGIQKGRIDFAKMGRATSPAKRAACKLNAKKPRPGRRKK